MVKRKTRHEAEAEASGIAPRRRRAGGASGPRDDEPKKRSGKKKRKGGGGKGGGESGSIIDNAQSCELATRVIASPLRIQEMEKPTKPYYEVFLSFRGPDTRRDIADYLYTSLIAAGIWAYRDDEELRVGEEIGLKLLQAIKQSKISIPIFSKNYATSKWCLMELVQMVECKEKWGRKIMPIFYDIAPSEVRHQTGNYCEAINSHKNKRLRYTDETIQNLKAALSKVGALRGWELKERGKGEFTEEVVQELLIELKKNYLAVSNCMVEMDDQVDQIELATFSQMKLVILDLSRSKITDEWDGWNHLKMAKSLKVLNLTRCEKLHKTPDLSANENLEQLILQGCMELVQVDRSIGKLKHLVLLNLEGCGLLQTLPDEIEELEALRELLVDGTSITDIPEWKGMEKLETLSATSCRLLSKCNLAGCSTSLLHLCLRGTSISELPFGNFGSLVELNLSWSSIRELPNSIDTMKNLRVLRMSYTPLEKLPRAIGMLEKLEEIHADDCRYLCGEIPSEFGRLSFLKILRLTGTGISNIRKLPKSMTELYLRDNLQMRCSDLSNLLNLRVLVLELKYRTPSHLAASLNWIGGLRKLESLWLGCDNLVTLPSDFNLLLKLRKLELIVNNLECLPWLPQNLSCLHIYGRKLMEKSINLSYLEELSELEVYNYEQLIEIRGLKHLKNLQRLRLDHLPSLLKLPDLTGLKKLRRLSIEDCPKLVEAQGQLELLEELYLQNCKSLTKLPNPLSFKHIEELQINGCGKLKEIQGLEDSENLNFLSVWDLPLLEKLPDLTNAKELEHLVLGYCPCLVEIRGRLESLKRLEIDGCGSLRRFSHPSSFKKLENLEINECERLEKILESDEYRDWKKVRSL